MADLVKIRVAGDRHVMNRTFGSYHLSTVSTTLSCACVLVCAVLCDGGGLGWDFGLRRFS